MASARLFETLRPYGMVNVKPSELARMVVRAVLDLDFIAGNVLPFL
jgi:hypothetical protein